MDSKILKLQRQGQEHYRKNELEAALACFDEIVDTYAGVPIAVLDNRAAVHAKRGDLQKALRDSEQIVRLAKTDVTGYLRAGQILQRMGKDETALDIYRYGMRNVPSSTPNAALLRSMREKLAAKLAPARDADPFDVLPVELVEMIAGYLTFKQLV